MLALINTMTNPAAVLICMMLSVYAGIPFYCSVLLTEAAVYSDRRGSFPAMYAGMPASIADSIFLNLASFGCGLVLSVFL